jgi:hypothetical protein
MLHPGDARKSLHRRPVDLQGAPDENLFTAVSPRAKVKFLTDTVRATLCLLPSEFTISQAHLVPTFSHCFHCFAPVLRVEPLQNAGHMVLHCVLRQMQFLGNLLIR